MNKNVSESVYRYTAIFEPAEEGGYTVSVPKFPGLVTEGDTFEEASAMARDAIKGYIEVLTQSGDPIPDPDTTSFTSPIDISFVSRSVQL